VVEVDAGAACERPGTGAAYEGAGAARTVAEVDAGAACERAVTVAAYEGAGAAWMLRRQGRL
jgi:hypothetical protein